MSERVWRRTGAAGAALLAAVLLGGCVETLVLGAGTVGVAAAQERSLGDALDDTTLHARVAEKLLSADEVLFRRVNLEVVEGRVLLTGVVREPEMRPQAARLAWAVDGVREVLNEIQVRDETGIKDFARDVWITAQLRAKMLADLEISDINYTVETINGIIYLMGIAQDRAELDRLTTHARNIAGVKQVVSHVLLKDDPRRVKSGGSKS